MLLNVHNTRPDRTKRIKRTTNFTYIRQYEVRYVQNIPKASEGISDPKFGIYRQPTNRTSLEN